MKAMSRIVHKEKTYKQTEEIHLHRIITELKDACARSTYAQFIFHAGRLGKHSITPNLEDIRAIAEDNGSHLNLKLILDWLVDHEYVTAEAKERTYKAGDRFRYDSTSAPVFTIIRMYNKPEHALISSDGITHAHAPVEVRDQHAIRLAELTAYPQYYKPLD